MDFAQYRRLDGINWSSLKPMAESPLSYRYRLSNPIQDKPSYALGRAIHCAILEPDDYDGRYISRPAGLDLRTSEGKEWRKRHAHMDVVPDHIDKIVTSIKAHTSAMSTLDGLMTEQTIQWAGHAGVSCKARLDAVGYGRVVDLKTTSKPLDRFFAEAAQYLYHGQIAFYLDGAIAAHVLPAHSVAYIIAVETTPPYDVGCFLLSQAEIQAGRVLYRHCIDQLLACTAAGMWPGRYPTVAPLSLPMWAEGMGPHDGAEETEEEVW